MCFAYNTLYGATEWQQRDNSVAMAHAQYHHPPWGQHQWQRSEKVAVYSGKSQEGGANDGRTVDKDAGYGAQRSRSAAAMLPPQQVQYCGGTLGISRLNCLCEKVSVLWLTKTGFYATCGATMLPKSSMTWEEVSTGTYIRYGRLGFILCGTQSTKNRRTWCWLKSSTRFYIFGCSNSNYSEYCFVFIILPKYYSHYNIPINTTLQHTTTKIDHCHPTLHQLCPLSSWEG